MIKAVFFDIDGTLLSFTTHRVPESAALALKKLRENGVKLFINTGRSPESLQYLQGILPIDFDGYIAVNGQYCYCGNEVIRSHPLPTKSIESFLPFLNNNNITAVFVELNYCYINRVNQRLKDGHKLLGSTVKEDPVDSTDRIYSHSVYQLCAYITEDEQSEALKHLPGCRAVRWHPSFADIIPADGGKGVGLLKMLEHFGISPEESIAFGDGGNDAEMLAAAGIGVAMGNASDKLKQTADYVTSDADSGGIYLALRHFGLLT